MSKYQVGDLVKKVEGWFLIESVTNGKIEKATPLEKYLMNCIVVPFREEYLTLQEVIERDADKMIQDRKIHVFDNAEKAQSECCEGDTKAIEWNPYNKVVQCHNCGHVYVPKVYEELSERK